MKYTINNAGWSIGAYCNANCIHCYSKDIRRNSDLLTKEDIITVLDKLDAFGIHTLNLGGNEPIFTHSLKAEESILPFLVCEVKKRNITLGITTNGTTMLLLNKLYPNIFKMVDDWDVSIDSPYAEEHDRNRGNGFFNIALTALDLAKHMNLSCSVVYCLMNFNCTVDHAEKLAELTNRYSVDLRINTLKPTRKELKKLEATPGQIFAFFNALSHFFKVTHNSDIGAAVSMDDPLDNCPCGKFSFAISPKKNGAIQITPCVYLQSYAVGNLLQDDISELLEKDIFRLFRNQDARVCPSNAEVKGCTGGCLAYTLLTAQHGKCDYRCQLFQQSITNLSPRQITVLKKHHIHENYLCTWIGTNK